MKPVLLTSSVLIALTAALRPWLRGRVDPRVQYALWLAAALRLLVPVNVAHSAYSVQALMSRAEEPAHLAQAIGQTAVPIPGMSYEAAYDQALREYQRDKTPQTSFTDLEEVERRARELQARAPTVAELAAKYARPVWLAGAAGTALWFLLVNLRLRRLLRDALPVEADCPLPVYVSCKLPSPCLCGTARPAVYVTPAALEGPDRLRHVLAHELTHYCHKDHWWALVRCLCLCVYWFDPLVWWAAALSRQDCELACDEGAIRRLGEGERLSYGRTLVDMIAAGRTPLFQTATTMTGGGRRVRERIGLIARGPKTAVAVVLAAALILGCAVGCTFTGAPEEAPGPEGSHSPEGSQSAKELDMAAAGLSREGLLDLQERLTGLPGEFGDDVVCEWLDIPLDGSVVFALSYWLDVSGEERAVGAGKLADVYLWSRPQFQRAYFGGAENKAGLTCFARTGDDLYFVLAQPTSAAFPRDSGPERYLELFEAVPDFIRETVLSTGGVASFDPEEMAGPVRTVRAVMDEITDMPGTTFTLYLPGDERDVRQYHTEAPPSDYWSIRVRGIATDFQWEELTAEQAAGFMGQGGGVSLRVESGADGFTCVTVYEGSQLVAVRTLDNEMVWYQARSLNGNEPLGVHPYLSPGPYEILRQWYDDVELDALRSTTVPDRGQSHEEIVREWTENWESVLTKTSPGSAYACTYVRTENIRADFHDYLEEDQLIEWVQSWNLSYSGADYGKTWFTFAYDTVFVLAEQNTSSALWVGNTGYYEGGDAPEGALIYMRVGYMHLTDEGWTCGGVGTGW